MAEKTAAKTSTRSSTKVFDISKPGKQAANASGRPIIVTNRPIMQDPMVAPDDAKVPATSADSPSLPKIKIEPLSEDDKKDSSDETDKGGPKTAADKPEEKDNDNPAGEGPDTKDDAEDEAAKPEAAENGPGGQGAGKTDASEAAADDGKPAVASSTEPSKSEAGQPASQDPASEPRGEDLQKADVDTAKLEAEAKKQAELDKLVEDKTYFLPINAVERHRSKVEALLGLLLVVALGFALVDLMLDAGFIKVSGVHALTHFFSS